MQIIFRILMHPWTRAFQLVNRHEGLNIHHIGTRHERRDLMIETLRKVGLEDYHARRYPQ